MATDFELIAQQVSSLNERLGAIEERLRSVETVNAGLQEAALTTARALQEISAHWDAVYTAMSRKEQARTGT